MGHLGTFLLGGGLIWLLPILYEVSYNRPPEIEEFLVVPTTGRAPLDAKAQVSASDPENKELIYAWYFGEAEVSVDHSSSRDFLKMPPGTHSLKVVVSDGSSSVAREASVSVHERELIRPILGDSGKLTRPLILDEPEKIVLLPEFIDTNGHPLEVRAHAISSVTGRAVKIQSFPTGSAGNGIDRANEESAKDGTPGTGESGSPGVHAAHGGHGLPGGNARDVTLKAVEILVPIEVDNRGQAGGDGGKGGKGGNGGDGGSGIHGEIHEVLFMQGMQEIWWPNCKRQPGHGGWGGPGGVGGRGGDAGPGGNGGSVSIEADRAESIFVMTDGGMAGSAGSGGSRGIGGKRGDPGLWEAPCRSPEGPATQRGIDGTNGPDGESSKSGQLGRIRVRIGDYLYHDPVARFEYSNVAEPTDVRTSEGQ